MALNKKEIVERLKTKYKIVFLNDETFEERASFTLTRLNVFIGLSTIGVFLVALVTSLIFFTSLREFIPGYADVKTKRNLGLMLSKTDSLEQLINANKIYLSSVNALMKGKEDPNLAVKKDEKSIKIEDIDLNTKLSKEELALRKMVDDAQKGVIASPVIGVDLGFMNEIDFEEPIRGRVEASFNPLKGINGVKFVSIPGEKVKASATGRIININYSPSLGFTIFIQHENNLLSIYKNCNKILKNIGTLVESGEDIGFLGPIQKDGSNPKFELEFWYKGNPINPLNYLNY